MNIKKQSFFDFPLGNKKIIFTLMFVLLMFSCFAENEFEKIVEASLKEVEGKDLPKPLGILFGNEQINFHIKMDNGNQLVLGLVTVDKKVKSISLDEISKPTLNVYTDETTIREIQEAENTFLELRKAMDEGKVTYKAVGFFNKIKFAFLSTFSKIVTLFVDEGAEIKETEEVEEQITGDAVTELEEDIIEEDDATKPEEETADQLTGGGVAELEEEVQSSEATSTSAEPAGPETHTVLMDNSGFNPKELTITAGDTVVWENTRTGRINKAMLIGVRDCVRIKSKLYGSGESFSWTFDEAGECTFVDGIMTTELIKIIIGE